ncbi:caspase-8-like [Gastrophryne carolinensis]
MNKDIQSRLLQITDELGKKDIQSILFLCGDKLKTADKEYIGENGTKLFSCLQKRQLVSDDLSFLKEILCKIARKDILKNNLRMTNKEITSLEQTSKHISSYRFLLYEIAQSLDSTEVKNVVYVLYPKRAQMSDVDSLMDVLREMEKDAMLDEGDGNLTSLKEILETIHRRDLIQKIEAYEKQETSPIQSDAQEDSSEPDKHSEKYTLDRSPHGLFVIVNNEDFTEARKKHLDVNDRSGSNKDAEAIKKVFGPRDYIVKEHRNLTRDKLLETIQNYGQEDHSNMDSFVCFILSHGDNGIVYGTDGKGVPIKALTSCFNGRNCRSLVGKPKVFFIQACQGDKLEKGACYEEDGNGSMYENDGSSLPITADFLTAFSTVEEYTSLRDPSHGSVYIQELCSILEDPHFIQTDLKIILTSLHKKIADGNYKTKEGVVKQMPSFRSELRKALVLPAKSESLLQIQ